MTHVSVYSEKSYPGYVLIVKKFVKEINADCYLFEHIKSGARVLKIAADDPNKTFSIAFNTIPVNRMPVHRTSWSIPCLTDQRIFR